MRRRRAVVVLVVGTAVLAFFAAMVPSAVEQGWSAFEQRWSNERSSEQSVQNAQTNTTSNGAQTALAALDTLTVKGKAPKTGYSREAFGEGWQTINGCSSRQIILYRDLLNPVVDDECVVQSGTLHDPYTGSVISYKKQDGSAVQIDHVVALSDAWQKGAQALSNSQRIQLANDPLELLAVDGAANQAKSDGDAATWLPSNKPFRCHYIARQITVKKKYVLWVTEAEKEAMRAVLSGCPEQTLIVP